MPKNSTCLLYYFIKKKKKKNKNVTVSRERKEKLMMANTIETYWSAALYWKESADYSLINITSTSIYSILYLQINNNKKNVE